jgi:hydroxymethylbilane synthase
MVKVGSRSSPLALQQTNTVIQALALKGIDCDIVTMTTKGDRLLGQPLPEIGGKGLFTEELEEALRLEEIDFVVHSLKDLPTTMAHDMLLVAILKRDDPHDCIVAKYPIQSLSELSIGSVIGTSSFRRSSQLKRQFPHLEFQNIRGNIHTRLSKLDSLDSPYSSIVLATA